VNNARVAPPRATYDGMASPERQGHNVPMQALDRRKGDSPDAYDTSSDEEPVVRDVGTANWNDIPDDFLTPRGKNVRDRSRSRGRRKGD
jgi:hypothetical protein